MHSYMKVMVVLLLKLSFYKMMKLFGYFRYLFWRLKKLIVYYINTHRDMLPIQSNTNQEGCNPISSNCVIWQGPDIPCITLCKGDSVSDVVAKLAQELCTLVDQLDINTFDLTCFNPICPTPENIHDLLQFVLDKICTLEQCCNGEAPPTPTGCPDCVVNIAPCFYFINQLGDQITTMQLTDYVTAIGNKICTILQTITTIQQTLANHEARLTYIELNCCSDVPQPEVTMFPVCVITPPPSDPVPISTIVAALEQQFCELRSATGTPNDIFLSIQKQCAGLDLEQSLGLPGVNMGSLSGWITQVNYNDLADSINNMWITICDLRAAVKNIQETCCPTGCEALVINMTATFSGTIITLFFTGSVPAGFIDCFSAGNELIITDCFGTQLITNIPVLTYVNNIPGYSIDISATPLSLACNFNLELFGCWTNPSTNTTCEREINYTIVNTTACPTITTTPTETTIPFTFNNIVGTPITYTIQLYDAAGVTLVTSMNFINPAIGPVGGTFSGAGVTSGTTYKIRAVVTVDGVDIFCPFGTVSTLPGSFWLWTGTAGDPARGYFLQLDGSKWLLG